MMCRLAHVIVFILLLIFSTLPPASLHAEDRQNNNEPVRVVTSRRQAYLPRFSTYEDGRTGINAWLPAPGGRTIQWTVSSTINLYEYGAADCEVKSHTYDLVWQLYLEKGLWTIDRRIINLVTDYQRDYRNISFYSWYNNRIFTGFGEQYLQCIGDQHVAVVEPGGAPHKLPTAVDTYW